MYNPYFLLEYLFVTTNIHFYITSVKHIMKKILEFCHYALWADVSLTAQKLNDQTVKNATGLFALYSLM